VDEEEPAVSIGLTLAPATAVTGSFRATIERFAARDAETASRWSVEPGERWLRVVHAEARTPEQGWKLHVSAALANAEEVLARVLSVTLAEDATFKVAASPEHLAELNEGNGQLSQVGKFVTIYPNDDGQAVRLARALDAATAGLPGPAIPSDRALRPGGLVHYRYGGFGDRHLQTPLGSIVPALLTPTGELVPDRRLPVYRAPDWVTDPFAAAGLTVDPPKPNPLVAGRFLILRTLHYSPRGAIHLALDIDAATPCVLKQARKHAHVREDGADARDALRHEAVVLARLQSDPHLPAVIALVEHEGDLFLAMTDLEGTTLERHLWAGLNRSVLLGQAAVVDLGRELAAALAAVHARGLVYRDLKSTNVLIGKDGRPRLIDFEAAQDLADATSIRPFGRGTRGYVSPQRAADEPSTVADDVYGLGAVLYFAATGAEPSQAPDPLSLLDRPVTLLNPVIGPGLGAVIARCLAPEPADRFSSMPALDEALAGVDPMPIDVPFGGETTDEPEFVLCTRSLALARRLGDTLCSAALRTPDGRAAGWSTTHEVGGGRRSRDLNTGSAGSLLALAEVVAAADPDHLATLTEAAAWLATAPRPDWEPLPGLYVGEAGAGVALLRAGQVLGDHVLIEEALARGRFVAALPHRSPDLFNGTAGRLRFHLLLWDETGAADQLAAAREAGDQLLAAAETAEGGLCWRIPPGYDGLSGQTNLGYAHGAAGIADALLDIWDATGDGRYRDAATAAARWLAGQAMPVLADESGVNWPVNPGEEPTSAFWCHGAVGIGRFFLRAAERGLLPEAADLAARAGRTAARGTRWASPTQCHGLAGNIEFLLDLYRASGDAAYLSEARSLGRLLEAFGRERRGRLVFPSESPAVVTPDYMVGYAGVAVCLLRLADPARRPHQLSRDGFAWERAAALR
jgi:hypothetical protein